MRTTVTLDDDVAELLREAMHRSQRSFKETLNTAVRSGLSRLRREDEPFVVESRPMGLRPGIDPTSMNKLLDELDTEADLARLRKFERRGHS